MRVGIIGAGCVGSVLAERISTLKHSTEIYFIAKERYAERLRNGIVVNDTRVNIKVLCEDASSLDLIFVCVKNFDLLSACEDIRPFVDGHTILFPLLNSVTPTPSIKEVYPNNRVLYGYISKIDAYNDGHGFKYNVAGDIHFGYSENSNPKPELIEIKEMLDLAGFTTFIDKDMKRGIWKKWMLNVGANQVSALTEADYIKSPKIPVNDANKSIGSKINAVGMTVFVNKYA